MAICFFTETLKEFCKKDKSFVFQNFKPWIQAAPGHAFAKKTGDKGGCRRPESILYGCRPSNRKKGAKL